MWLPSRVVAFVLSCPPCCDVVLVFSLFQEPSYSPRFSCFLPLLCVALARVRSTVTLSIGNDRPSPGPPQAGCVLVRPREAL